MPKKNKDPQSNEPNFNPKNLAHLVLKDQPSDSNSLNYMNKKILESMDKRIAKP